MLMFYVLGIVFLSWLLVISWDKITLVTNLYMSVQIMKRLKVSGSGVGK